MITAKVKEIKQLMKDALALRGITGEDAQFIIDDYMESELEGHQTHGLSKFLMIDAGLAEREGAPEVISESASFAKIDGHRELGHITALKAVRMSIEKAKATGIGLVAFSNNSRYSRVTPYTRMIADAGLIGVMTNNGGPCCVAPFSGKRAIFGTNPLSFGFPGEKSSYVFDFATAEKVWGAVRQCYVEGKPLPPNSFIDEDGSFTSDPEKAYAGVPFGGPKGNALCFALEVMTGAFIGVKMGLETKDEFDLGYLVCALSPEMFTDLASFKTEMEKIAGDVRTCPPRVEGQKVFVPGEIFGGTLASARNREEVDMPDDVYERLKKMSVSLEGGYENNRMMN